jgi:predicted RNA-binding Zn ribbon-like protein
MGELALLGGALCLDFVNTAGWRGQSDSAGVLRDFEDLVAWTQHAGGLSTRQGRDLLKRAASEPARARTVHEQAISLREALYLVFSSLAAGRAAEPADLATINATVTDAYQHLRLALRPPSEFAPRPPSELAPLGDSFAWEWHEADGSLELPVWMIARSAAELLTSDSLGRVRECAGERCDWLFLDASRNRSRRWCDMAECGNRAKAQRSYARRRNGAAPGDAAGTRGHRTRK